MTQTKKKDLLIVSCRVEYAGREFNIEVPVVSYGYDDAIEKVKSVLNLLGGKFSFIHWVKP